MLFWCVSEVSLHLRRFVQSVHDNSVTMRTTARNIVWYLLCCIFAGNVFFACTKPVSVTGDREVQLRFDSAYHYVVNNMLMSYENMDTMLALCDEMASVSPSQLEPRQISLWAYSYALASSVYINHNELKKGLLSIRRGVQISDSIGNKMCYNRCISALALIYSNWKLNDRADELFSRVIATTDKEDLLSTANAYLANAIHLVNTA